MFSMKTFAVRCGIWLPVRIEPAITRSTRSELVMRMLFRLEPKIHNYCDGPRNKAEFWFRKIAARCRGILQIIWRQAITRPV